MDGWITIGTKVDQSGLEKDLKVSQQKLKQFDKDNELLIKKKAKIEVDLQEYENAKRQIEEMTNKDLELAQTEEQVNQLLELEKSQLEELNNKYGGKLEAEAEINKKIEENNNQRQLELGKIEKINQELQKQKGLSSIKEQINDVGKGITSTIKKVTGWGLALFGIRGAYSMISKSMSIISQYDKQLGADIKYISYALAMTLKPIVDWLVKAMMTLLNYINYIANAWFGVNLFKNSGVQDFQKSMGASEKSAKNIEKSLASFDEINKLNDTSSGGSSGGGGAVGPSMDLSKISGDVPGWVKWIADHKDEILTIAGAVGGAILLAKGVEWVNNIAGVVKSIGGIGSSMGGISGDGLAIAGSLAVIAGCAYEWYKATQDTKKEIDKINKVGMKNNKEWVEKTSDVNDLNREINNKQLQGNDLMKEMNKATSDLFGGTKRYGETLVNNLNIQDNMIQKEWEMYQNGELTEEQKKDFIELLRHQVGYLDDSYETLKKQHQETGNIEELSDKYEGILREIDADHKNIWDKTGEVLKNTMKQKDETKEWETNTGSVWEKLKNIANQTFKNKDLVIDVSANTSKAESVLGKLVNGLGSSITTMFKGLGNALGGEFKAIWSNLKLPTIKLASGGIIHNPGRGVPLGTNIIGGEGRDAEAIIPLNDKTLNALGEAIARNMTINLTNVNQMNGRTISRELQRISNENDFSFNG